ncbi:MAG: hypothetical protein J6R15_00480 [Bacteroidales bacterium]|jgi:VanZ family protein|nr:hypothetical protein [Bacteroidales bacterium]
MKARHESICIILFCIYLTAVGVLCFVKPSSLPEMDIKTFMGIPIDKILHFLMFFPYPILSGAVFIRRDCRLTCGFIVLGILTATGIGVAYGTEAIQACIGYRSYEKSDINADLYGLVAGCLAAAIYLIYTRLKK